MDQNGQPNPFAPLGLPPTWSPTPLQWNLAKVRITTPAGVADAIVLIVHSANGTQGYQFSIEEARQLADRLLEQCTGLTLANGHRPIGDPRSTGPN